MHTLHLKLAAAPLDAATPATATAITPAASAAIPCTTPVATGRTAFGSWGRRQSAVSESASCSSSQKVNIFALVMKFPSKCT